MAVGHGQMAMSGHLKKISYRPTEQLIWCYFGCSLHRGICPSTALRRAFRGSCTGQVTGKQWWDRLNMQQNPRQQKSVALFLLSELIKRDKAQLVAQVGPRCRRIGLRFRCHYWTPKTVIRFRPTKDLYYVCMPVPYIEDFAHPPLCAGQFRETAEGKWQDGEEKCSKTPENTKQ